MSLNPGLAGVGTLGFFARDASGSVVAVTAAHVVNADTDDPTNKKVFVGDRDGATLMTARLGHVSAVRPNPPSMKLAEDTALVHVDTHSLCTNRANSSHTPQTSFASHAVSQTIEVWKNGRTSGITMGEMEMVPVRVRTLTGLSWAVTFKITSTGTGAFSLRGDSGSAVIETATGRVAGIVIAGPTDDDAKAASYCVPIHRMVAELGIQPVVEGDLGPNLHGQFTPFELDK